MKNISNSIFRILTPKIFYNKTIEPVETLPLPERVVILIAKADSSGISVSTGDDVNSGQRIGASESGPVFSTVTGKIKNISEFSWLNGENYHAVEITRNSEDKWDSLFTPADNISGIDREELLSRLESAGYSVDVFRKENIDKVIINCCENDVLTSDIQATILEKKNLLQAGIGLAESLSGCDNIILAVQSGFSEKVQEISNAQIRPVKPIYPWCMDELLPRYLKEEGNICVIRADVLISMAMTLQTGRPAYERIITLIFEGNKPAKNIKVRIGTPASEILKHEKIQTDNMRKIILGGAMRGQAVYNDDFPVQAGTNGLLLQGADDIVEISSEACAHCGACVRACPQKLQINLLARYSEFGLFDQCEDLNIWDCIECGMCAFVCMSHRPLVQFVQFAKKELIKKRMELAREEASNEQ